MEITYVFDLPVYKIETKFRKDRAIGYFIIAVEKSPNNAKIAIFSDFLTVIVKNLIARFLRNFVWIL